MHTYRETDLLYDNPLASPQDVAGFRLEGEATLSFPEGRLRMANRLDPSLGQQSNFVFWCPRDLPDNIAISFDFCPVSEPGLAILFFAARGHGGRDLFDNLLAPRNGPYAQYHHGDIDCYHVSYFRRRIPQTRAFHVCNLRKSYGNHIVATGADPLPDLADMNGSYRLRVIKAGPLVQFQINGLEILRFVDDGSRFGPLLAGGKIGFRQMAPLVAEYANLQVHRVGTNV